MFILDALAPLTEDTLTEDTLTVAADDFIASLRRLGPDVRSATRLITAAHR